MKKLIFSLALASLAISQTALADDPNRDFDRRDRGDRHDERRGERDRGPRSGDQLTDQDRADIAKFGVVATKKAPRARGTIVFNVRPDTPRRNLTLVSEHPSTEIVGVDVEYVSGRIVELSGEDINEPRIAVLDRTRGIRRLRVHYINTTGRNRAGVIELRAQRGREDRWDDRPDRPSRQRKAWEEEYDRGFTVEADAYWRVKSRSRRR